MLTHSLRTLAAVSANRCYGSSLLRANLFSLHHSGQQSRTWYVSSTVNHTNLPILPFWNTDSTIMARIASFYIGKPVYYRGLCGSHSPRQTGYIKSLIHMALSPNWLQSDVCTCLERMKLCMFKSDLRQPWTAGREQDFRCVDLGRPTGLHRSAAEPFRVLMFLILNGYIGARTSFHPHNAG